MELMCSITEYDPTWSYVQLDNASVPINCIQQFRIPGENTLENSFLFQSQQLVLVHQYFNSLDLLIGSHIFFSQNSAFCIYNYYRMDVRKQRCFLGTYKNIVHCCFSHRTTTDNLNKRYCCLTPFHFHLFF